MKTYILDLYYEYRPGTEPEQFMSVSEQFDLLPFFLKTVVEDWIHSYETLGGSGNYCSRQVAAMLFASWKKHHNDYK